MPEPTREELEVALRDALWLIKAHHPPIQFVAGGEEKLASYGQWVGVKFDLERHRAPEGKDDKPSSVMQEMDRDKQLRDIQRELKTVQKLRRTEHGLLWGIAILLALIGYLLGWGPQYKAMGEMRAGVYAEGLKRGHLDARVQCQCVCPQHVLDGWIREEAFGERR